MRYIKLLFMSAFIFLIMLTGCKKESKITVTYIIDDEVYETCELNVGEKAANLEVNEKDNLVFTGWKLRNKDYDFSEAVTSNIKLKGSFVTLCELNGHTEVVDEAVDATCKEEGLTEGSHCSVCNEVLTKQYPISKSISHSYSEATCKDPATCTICGATTGEKLPHTVVVDEAVEATCKEEGLTEGSHCSVCNEVLTKQYPISKSIRHSYSEATCLNPETCTICGKVKNDKLGDHSIVEANYEKGSHCSVCGEEFGEKLLYEVVDLEYEINYENEMLTTEEYNNLKENLVVYGVLNDNTKVKLNNEDIEIYYESIEVDESSSKYVPPVFLKYNNYVKQTNKLYYGILTLMDIDFTKIESAGEHMLRVKDEYGSIAVLSDEFYEYLSEFGYDKFTLPEFFEGKGWEYHHDTWQTDLGPKYSQYLTKDNDKIIVNFRQVMDEQYIVFYFNILNENE